MAGSGLNLQQYMHGYTRQIYYEINVKTGDQNPNYIWYIWEGGSDGSYSRFSQFGRFIDAWQNLAVGWWWAQNEFSMKGKGITLLKQSLKN